MDFKTVFTFKLLNSYFLQEYPQNTITFNDVLNLYYVNVVVFRFETRK